MVWLCLNTANPSPQPSHSRQTQTVWANSHQRSDFYIAPFPKGRPPCSVNMLLSGRRAETSLARQSHYVTCWGICVGSRPIRSLARVQSPDQLVNTSLSCMPPLAASACANPVATYISASWQWGSITSLQRLYFWTRDTCSQSCHKQLVPSFIFCWEHVLPSEKMKLTLNHSLHFAAMAGSLYVLSLPLCFPVILYVSFSPQVSLTGTRS